MMVIQRICRCYFIMFDSNSFLSRKGYMSSSDGDTIVPSGICLADSFGENI